jgi:hypothetical protein
MTDEPRNSQIVRWEILPDLPAEGPSPIHFDFLHPAHCWMSLVVRFWRADGDHWVGTFQGIQDWSNKVMLWPEADSVVVISHDALYLVNASDPANHVSADFGVLADDVMLDDTHNVLFVASPGTILAFGRDRQLIWSQSEVGGYCPEFRTCKDGVLTVEVEDESGDGRQLVRLIVENGERV